MRISFYHRITAALLVMASLVIFIGYFAFITTNNLQRVSQAIMKENVSSLKAAEELELAVLNQKGLVASYFLDENPFWLNTLEEKKKDFYVWFNKAQEVALTDNEKGILEDIYTQYKKYDTQRNKTIKIFEAGRKEEARKMLLTDVRNSIDSLYNKCEDLILANEVLIAKAEVSSQDNVFRMTVLIWTTIIVTLCLGTFLGFFVARNINEQLIRSAKMASLGKLSANIAHEIRNPLTAVKMRLYTLAEEIKTNPGIQEDLNVISEEINRMEKTVKHFLDFARAPELNLQNCDINEILDGTITLVSRQAVLQKIQIQKKLDAVIPDTAMDKEQMRQVFLNVMLNALEAMPSGGILSVLTSMTKDKEFKENFEIVIKDTGTGIPVDHRKRVFEPFFTTKSEGTGLGLFIASRIIQMHGGVITVENSPDKGAVITIRIPKVC
ncbi:MAG: ATP-binding protein [Candidatus Omnitrophota bacterium]